MNCAFCNKTLNVWDSSKKIELLPNKLLTACTNCYEFLIEQDNNIKNVQDSNMLTPIFESLSDKSAKFTKDAQLYIDEYISYVKKEKNIISLPIEVQELNDIYEYSVETILDKLGATDINTLSTILNKYATSGWRLKSCFTNELGKNSLGISIGNAGGGSNSTTDQIVLIFERRIKSYNNK